LKGAHHHKVARLQHYLENQEANDFALHLARSFCDACPSLLCYFLNCQSGGVVKPAISARIAMATAGVLAVVTTAGTAAAKKPAKIPAVETPPPPAVHNWSGFYAGVNAGIAWGQFDPVTSTVRGGTIGAGPVSLINAAGAQTAGPFGFSGGM
jgi:hypothetical protein